MEALAAATRTHAAIAPEDALAELRTRVKQEPLLEILCRALRNKSDFDDADLHLVGGSVRDALLGLPNYDLDLATALTPLEIVARLERADIRVVATGLKHQTVTAVPVSGGPNVEITTFRGPGLSPNGGVIASNSIVEDLCYRDFTINAMALNLLSGELIDPHCAVDDLKQLTLKAVGSPHERYSEDPLRMLRLLRLACRLDLNIEAQTLATVRKDGPLLKTVSIERVRDEFSKLLVSPHPGRGLRLLARLDLLVHFLPELIPCIDFEQNRFHPLDVFEHTISVVEKTSSDLVLRLSALFHDIGKPPTLSIDAETGDRHFFRHESIGAEMTATLMERLRYPHRTIDAVVTLVATHMRPLEAGPGGLRRLLRDTGELFPAWRELKEADAASCAMDPEVLSSQLRIFDTAMIEVQAGPAVSPLKNLALNGHDVLSAGVPAGPQVGLALRALHERVLDDPSLNTRERLLEILSAEFLSAPR